MRADYPDIARKWLAGEREKGLQCFLLLDGALDVDVRRILFQKEANPSYKLLFHKTPLQDSMSVSPLLVALQEDSGILEWFLEDEQYFGTLGYLISTELSMEELDRYFKKRVYVELENNTHALFRFYDPSVFVRCMLLENGTLFNYIMYGLHSFCLYSLFGMYKDCCIYSMQNTLEKQKEPDRIKVSFDSLENLQNLEEQNIIVSHMEIINKSTNLYAVEPSRSQDVDKHGVKVRITPTKEKNMVFHEFYINSIYDEIVQMENKYGITDLNALLELHLHMKKMPHVLLDMLEILENTEIPSSERVRLCLKLQ